MTLEQTLRARAQGDGPVTLQATQLRTLLDKLDLFRSHSVKLNTVAYVIYRTLNPDDDRPIVEADIDELVASLTQRNLAN